MEEIDVNVIVDGAMETVWVLDEIDVRITVEGDTEVETTVDVVVVVVLTVTPAFAEFCEGISHILPPISSV